MSWDLAIDYNTGDLIPTPSNDFAARIGEDTVQQRIRVRLLAERDGWTLDPSDGAFGSNLNAILRMPRSQAMAEGGLLVREALEPMDDIEVTNVVFTPVEDERVIQLQVEYRDLLVEDSDTQQLNLSVPVD